MPVWHDKTAQAVKDGKLVVIGVVQEQHPDRPRLFAQWKKLDMPILHDPINALELTAVLVALAIDEHGIVRMLHPSPEAFQNDFMAKDFKDDVPAAKIGDRAATSPPDLKTLTRRAEKDNTSRAWRDYGDALALWGGRERINDAIDAYGRAARLDPKDGNSHFRLGVAQRMRYELGGSGGRQPDDFRLAVDSWGQALDLNPNHYIYRRRIQQYGPRLDKPYAFYDWIAQAEKEITARGDKPVALAVRPGGAEIAHPIRKFAEEARAAKPPDPDGKIHRDKKELIGTEVIVVPARVRPGQSACVHVVFRPSEKQKAHWNNEAEPLRLWVDAPEGWQVSQRLLAAQGTKPESTEVRELNFEVKVPTSAQGKVRLTAYALYHVCEDAGGMCLFLRKDVEIDVEVAK